MRGSKNLEVERFVNYLASSKDLKFSKTALRRFKKEVDIKHIVEGFQTYDESTSKLPPSRRGIKLSSKDQKIADRIGISKQTMIDEVIKEKYNVFMENKKIMRNVESPILSDFKKFSARNLEKKLEYKYATLKDDKQLLTRLRRQITLKEGIKKKDISRSSEIGKAIRGKDLASWKDYDSKKITYIYDSEATQKLYEKYEDSYRRSHNGEKPPSPPPKIDAIYKIYYDGLDTDLKCQISEEGKNKNITLV